MMMALMADGIFLSKDTTSANLLKLMIGCNDIIEYLPQE
jgi:hypothetical protein